MKTKLRHTLVQYHGGGYEGCFWEWNFFYIDADGDFHCIEATGHAGCKNANQADDMLADDGEKEYTYTYDVMDIEQIKEFAKEANGVHVLDVLSWFNQYNDPDIEFLAVCIECN